MPELKKTYDPKVFGIGLARTGTTSLHLALQILGYRSVHFPSFNMRWVKAGILKLRNGYRTYDAMSDAPVALLYKRLDREYPGSKFILTVRADREKWLDSVQNHKNFKPGNQIPRHLQLLHKRLYGYPFFDRNSYRQAYVDHFKDVMSYFQNRPDDLLLMDITEGDSWEILCRFLGKPDPEQPFPHVNSSSESLD